ncbi:MAG: type II toxin-antitoxin system RelE/ParE family toxin [Desulfuromusa sp.]
MRTYTIIFTKKAAKDVTNLTPQLKAKLKDILLNKISKNPYEGEKLVGDLDGFYSVRLNYQDRIIYTVEEKSQTVCIHRARTHYGE